MPTGAECPFGTQFPPPATNLDTGRPLHGFCESTNTGYQHADCPFAVVDRLVVPADLAEGDWVLSFRWVSRALGVWVAFFQRAPAMLVRAGLRADAAGVDAVLQRPRHRLRTTSRGPQVLCAAKYVVCLRR